MIAAPIKSESSPEPTISDVMVILVGMNTRFERVESVLSMLQIGQDNLLVEVRDIKRRVTHLEYQIADLQDSVDDLFDAEAKDATASISHEGRIIRLEKMHSIKAVSPQHLAEIE
jgi:uncharacterized protein YlxW (UPF0749 family)